MAAPEHPTTLLGISRPSPDFVRTPDLARDAAQTVLEEARHEAQEAPQLRACIALMRGRERLGAALMAGTE